MRPVDIKDFIQLLFYSEIPKIFYSVYFTRNKSQSQHPKLQVLISNWYVSETDIEGPKVSKSRSVFMCAPRVINNTRVI